MAQKSQRNFKAKEPPIRPVFDFLSNLFDVDDIDDIRVGYRDFSRDGKLSPELLITILLFMAGDGNRSGYTHVLSRFWDQAEDFGIELPSAIPVERRGLVRCERQAGR